MASRRWCRPLRMARNSTLRRKIGPDRAGAFQSESARGLSRFTLHDLIVGDNCRSGDALAVTHKERTSGGD